MLIDWRMGLVTLIPIALGIGSMSFMMTKKGEQFRQWYLDALEEMSSEAVEYVRGIPVVKTFGQSVYAFKRFVSSITRYKELVIGFAQQFPLFGLLVFAISRQQKSVNFVRFAALHLALGIHRNA